MAFPQRIAACLFAFACGMAALLAGTAARADYPERPITLVVPFPAGGTSDKVGRDLAEALHKVLGQPVLVDNPSGAGGLVGTARVAHAAPDGYTLLVNNMAFALAPALYKKLGYDTLGDFEFLGLVNESPSALIGRPTLPANNFAELRQWIAANGDKVNLAHGGVGSAAYLCDLVLQSALGAHMTLVPYKGSAGSMTALMGGQVDLTCTTTINATPQIEAKQVKAYGVTSTQRATASALAHLPTLAEAGLKDFSFTVWHGLFAPRGTPPAVLARLNAALRTALKDPDLIRREEALGITVVTDKRLEPAEHKKYVAGEMARWSRVIKESGQLPE